MTISRYAQTDLIGTARSSADVAADSAERLRMHSAHSVAKTALAKVREITSHPSTASHARPLPLLPLLPPPPHRAVTGGGFGAAVR